MLERSRGQYCTTSTLLRTGDNVHLPNTYVVSNSFTKLSTLVHK